MPKIISNTSCLILLDNINALDILQKLYQNIYLTEEVAQEYGKPLEDWMNVVTVKDKNYLRILNASVDLGEASTIALALQMTTLAIEQQFSDHSTDYIDAHGNSRQPRQDGVEMNARVNQHHQRAQPGAEFMHAEQRFGVARSHELALAQRVIQRTHDQQGAGNAHVSPHPDQVEPVQYIVTRQGGGGE